MKLNRFLFLICNGIVDGAFIIDSYGFFAGSGVAEAVTFLWKYYLFILLLIPSIDYISTKLLRLNKIKLHFQVLINFLVFFAREITGIYWTVVTLCNYGS